MNIQIVGARVLTTRRIQYAHFVKLIPECKFFQLV